VQAAAQIARHCYAIDAGQLKVVNRADDLFIARGHARLFAAAMPDGQDHRRGGGMGIDMQIVYLGFAGSAQIESEAAAQLVRLERFGRAISGCHLAIEAIHEYALTDISGVPRAVSDTTQNHRMFDARLDLILRTGELVPLAHQQSADPDEAVHAAFDAAERLLERGVVRV
jgi:hypothetical protein